MASAGPYASLHLAPADNHTSTPPLMFLQAGCPSCRPANSVKALKANSESANTTTRELDGENECQQNDDNNHHFTAIIQVNLH